ncbi:MAG: hypothetical protein RR767_14005 [Acinetobacter sp.]
MSKEKAKVGFGDDLDDIIENPEVTLDDTEIHIEYSRNLMHKNVYEKHTPQKDIERERAHHGKHITCPVFYEEEKLLKLAAENSKDGNGNPLSMNEFIRQALIEKATEVLGKSQANKVLKDKYDLMSIEATTNIEREEQRAKRKNLKKSATRSKITDYPIKKTKIIK